MNKVDRTAISALVAQLEEIKAAVESLKDDIQYRHDNIPESLQSTDRYETEEEKIANIDSAFDYIGNAIDDLNEAVS